MLTAIILALVAIFLAILFPKLMRVLVVIAVLGVFAVLVAFGGGK